MVLVCFAVHEESRAFLRACGEQPNIKVLITGMGKRNAERTLREILQREKPELVLTCGFAGGLRPGLETGVVLYSGDGDRAIEQRLEAAGARKARFAFSDRVATTAAEKRALWQETKADAVEMESQALRAICAERQVPAAIVRVVLDTAEEDLPLDFNALMTAEQKLNYAKLALSLVKLPGSVAGLLKLRKQSVRAAEKLAHVLTGFIGVSRGVLRG
jgi:adenosylhomocysteine nucleosidase